MYSNRTGRTEASHHREPPRGSCAVVRRAFTLIELSMVLATVALVAAIAAPRYTESMSRYRLQAAAQRIADDLRRAQAAARATSSPTAIEFDIDNDTYSIVGVRSLNRADIDETVNTADEYTVQIHDAAFGIKPAAEFNGYGVPVSGGTVKLRCRRFTLAVTLDEHTGIITIGSPQNVLGAGS